VCQCCTRAGDSNPQVAPAACKHQTASAQSFVNAQDQQHHSCQWQCHHGMQSAARTPPSIANSTTNNNGSNSSSDDSNASSSSSSSSNNSSSSSSNSTAAGQGGPAQPHRMCQTPGLISTCWVGREAPRAALPVPATQQQQPRQRGRRQQQQWPAKHPCPVLPAGPPLAASPRQRARSPSVFFTAVLQGWTSTVGLTAEDQVRPALLPQHTAQHSGTEPGASHRQR